MNKKELRKFIKLQKEKISPEEVMVRSKKVFNKLYEQNCYKENSNIYTYVNYNQEIYTKELIEHSINCGKNVYVPKVFGDKMLFYRIGSLNELQSGAYGILEPVATEYDLNDERVMNNPSGLMIMPGLAFDKNHNRIGYGGGYYDRYLCEHTDFFKVALAFDFQIVENIETDNFDIPVQMVITESDIF